MRKMLYLHVYYTAKDGDDLMNFLREAEEAGIVGKTRKEKGCLQYEYFVSTENDKEMLLLEKWETAEDQKVHGTQDHFRMLGEIKSKYGLETRIEKIEK